MKKNIKYLVMAAVALLSMSACTNEMDEQNAANGGELQPVQFQMVTTRTVTDAVNRVTSWKVGDAIGIFALPAGTTDIANAKAANAKYVLGSDDVWKAEADSEIYPEEALDYYAYYPYQEGVTNPSAISISAKADQSMANGDDYGASDVLAGQTKNVAAGQGNVTLIFKHMFAMVEVKVEGDKVAKQPAKVELKGVKLDAVLDIMAATPAATVKTEAEAKDIPMFYLAREGNAEAQVQPFSFRAVVPEQEIAGNTPLVAIYAPDADNKTYTMQHADAVPYKAGVFRQLNVNIGSSKVSLTIPVGDLTISPWEPSEAIGGEGGEVITPIIVPFSGDNFTEITHNEAAMSSASEGWYKIIRANNDPVTISMNADNTTTWKKAAQIEYKSTWDAETSKVVNNSYYIGVINYQHKSALDVSTTHIYKLTARIKGAQNEKNEPSALVFMVRTATFNTSFLVSTTSDKFNDTETNQGTIVTRKPTTADTWEEFSIYIDLSQKSTINGSIKSADISNKITSTEAADYAGFDLRIYTNSPATSSITEVNANVSISDIKIEPYITSAP